MKEKITDVRVLYVHDQGETGQIRVAGVGEMAEPVQRTIDVNAAQKPHDRLLLILALACLTNTPLKSVTLEETAVTGIGV